MTLYGTYSADSIEDIVDSINHLHKNLTNYEKMLGSSQPYWHKDNILERKIVCMIFNNLLYLHELQLEYVNVYKDLIRLYYIHVNEISSVIPPSQLKKNYNTS